MELTVADIVAIREPAAVIDPVRLEKLTELTGLYLSESAFGDKYLLTRALLVLHWLSLEAMANGSTLTASGGPVTSEQEGDLAVGYGSNGSTSSKGLEGLGGTAYGAELEALIKRTCFGMFPAVDV